MTRWRVTDRTTGDVLDADTAVDAPGLAAPGDPSSADPTLDDPAPVEAARPIVLASATASPVRGRTGVEVVIAGWRFELDLEDAVLAELRERATAEHQGATHHGPTQVRAIIPGRVVSVAVAAGETVTAGQRLLAVEAMKMENELRAPRDGTIERVIVAVGETVELGDPLVVIG
jgi:biotin carboxyl carrier protein